MEFINLIGKKFGRLTVVKYTRIKGRSGWQCLCDCGNIAYVRSECLKRKLKPTVSCGCYNNEKRKKHNMADSTEYKTWCGIKARCYNNNSPYYRYYGGRGIKVCREWRNSFKAFISDMGKKTHPNQSIDRIDVNGNYEPSNCRWATRSQQMRNTRKTAYYTHNGITKPIADWADKFGIKPSILFHRLLDQGWDFNRAINNPIQKRNRQYEYLGIKKTTVEWARQYNIQNRTLRQRLERYKWPIDKALNTPVRICTKTKGK